MAAALMAPSAALLMAPSAAIGVQPAASDEGARISITTLNPAVLTLGAGITLGGRLTNSSSPVALTVRITISSSPVTNRSSLDAVTTDASTAADAVRSGRTLATISVPAGQQQWSASIPSTDLGLGTSSRPGVYVIAAGTYSGGALVAANATVAPFTSTNPSFHPSHVVMLWPVTSVPMSDLNGGINNDRLTAALSSHGTLQALLRAGSTSGVSWLVDPALITTLRTAASASTAGPGSAASAANRQAAGVWLRGLQSIANTQRFAALPASVPDAAALDATGLGDSFIAAQRRSRAQLHATLNPRYQVTQSVAWPCVRGATCISDNALRRLGDTRGAHASVVVLPDSAASSSVRWFSGGGVQRLPGHANIPLLYTDAALDNAIAGQLPLTSAALRQRILSELALISFERPGRARTVAATAPMGVESTQVASAISAASAAMRLAAAAGLIAPVQLSKLTGQGADGIIRGFISADKAPGNPKQAARLAAVARRDALRGALLPVSAGDRAKWSSDATAMFLATTSLNWRKHPKAQRMFAQKFLADAAVRRNGVEVLAAGHVWIGTSRGTIPFTLHNTLSVAVRVFPRLTANAPTRITFTNTPASVTLQPGERAGMPTEVTLLGGAAVKVMVEVRDAKGRLINVPRATLVSTSAYARFSLYIVVGAFIILVLLMINNIRRTINRRRGTLVGDDPNAFVDVDADVDPSADDRGQS